MGFTLLRTFTKNSGCDVKISGQVSQYT